MFFVQLKAVFGLRSFIPFVSQNIKDKYKIRPAKAGRFCPLAFTISSSRFFKTAFPSFVLFNDSHSFVQSLLFCPALNTEE
jgi:hypothetical protein